MIALQPVNFYILVPEHVKAHSAQLGLLRMQSVPVARQAPHVYAVHIVNKQADRQYAPGFT